MNQQGMPGVLKALGKVIIGEDKKKKVTKDDQNGQLLTWWSSLANYLTHFINNEHFTLPQSILISSIKKDNKKKTEK